MEAHPHATVQRDFDRIARIEEQSPALAPIYGQWLLSHLPRECGTALEVGCGTGAFTRLLASRAARVVAFDLSREMLRVAGARMPRGADVEFVRGDAAGWPFAADRFDCIVSLQTLHHLPLAATLRAMRDALRPGGTLLLMDLVHRPGLRHLPLNLAATAWRLLRGPRAPGALRIAYQDHGRGEVHPRPDQLAGLFEGLLPGAELRHHLLWRYSVRWTRPLPP